MSIPDITLTNDERMATAFIVAHMIDKHGYSSIVGREHGRVDLEAFYTRLSGAGDEAPGGTAHG